MASPFAKSDAALTAATVRAFGEGAVLRPRVFCQYGEPGADQERQEQAVTGIFSAGPAESPLKGPARSGDFAGATRLATLSAEFWIGADMVASLVARPMKGDTITLIGRDGCPVYTISRVEPSDLGDLNLVLAREDQPQ
jgi:hypothetical protein